MVQGLVVKPVGERLDSELSEYADGVRGHVRVMANASSIMEFLPEELFDFMLANPRIQADIAVAH